MPMCAARSPIEIPSRPSTVARSAAATRIARRLRAPSDRGRGVGLSTESETTLDKIARSVVLYRSTNDRAIYERSHVMHVTNVVNVVNGVDVDRLLGTIEHVSAEPTLARFQFR